MVHWQNHSDLDFLFFYIDDGWVASENEEQHREHFRFCSYASVNTESLLTQPSVFLEWLKYPFLVTLLNLRVYPRKSWTFNISMSPKRWKNFVISWAWSIVKGFVYWEHQFQKCHWTSLLQSKLKGKDTILIHRYKKYRKDIESSPSKWNGGTFPQTIKSSYCIPPTWHEPNIIYSDDGHMSSLEERSLNSVCQADLQQNCQAMTTFCGKYSNT